MGIQVKTPEEISTAISDLTALLAICEDEFGENGGRVVNGKSEAVILKDALKIIRAFNWVTGGKET